MNVDFQSANILKVRHFLRSFKVGIAGAGGLGSNCAVALARTGIGHLVVVDFDIVEPLNLNRQYFFANQIGKKKVEALKEVISWIDPDIQFTAIHEKLSSQNLLNFFKTCDIIVEAFDKIDQKKMIAETILSSGISAPLVMGSGMAGLNHTQLLVERYDRLIVCGDQITEVNGNQIPMAPRVAMVANLQANEVLNFLMKDFTFDYEDTSE